MSRLNEILKIIKKAKNDYYLTGRSELTDKQYDDLVEEAEKLGYHETVGTSPVDNINKIKHEHQMLSLNKAHTGEEVKKFINNKEFVIMDKADGLSISATYIDGLLTRLETRGDGEIGNDVMFHADSFINLPKQINKTGKYVIDGECVIFHNDFETINKKLAESEKFSNPRNLAAGSLNQLDPNVSRKRYLRFYAWDVIDGGCNSLYENLEEATTLGFDTVYHCKTNDTDHLTDLFDMIRKTARNTGFPIDGVVIKYDNLSYGKSLGTTGHHPLNAIAYKFEDDKYPTKLIRVEWQVGKTSQITPVAVFQPVEISGSVVEKCSLHNLTVMKSLQLTKGCTVYVYKANDIIPQIDSAEPDGNGELEVPKVCPICGKPTKIVKDNDSEVLMCENDLCPGKLLGLWKHFVSRKAMNIDGLSEQTLKLLLVKEYINDLFVTIYELKDYKDELYKLPGFGKKSVDNLLKSIEKSKENVDFVNFITAFSIPGIGEGQSKIIAKKFPTFDEFMKACGDGFHFDSLDGIGEILNRNIHKWWVNNNYQMIDVGNLLTFKQLEIMNKPEGSFPLAGKTFVVTGSVHHFKNRDELKAKIEELGGKNSGSVSKNTNYLINNDVTSTSGKNAKAKELGIPIISEEDFLKMIDD